MAYYLGGGEQSIKDEKYAFKLCQKSKQKTRQMKCWNLFIVKMIKN